MPEAFFRLKVTVTVLPSTLRSLTSKVSANPVSTTVSLVRTAGSVMPSGTVKVAVKVEAGSAIEMAFWPFSSFTTPYVASMPTIWSLMPLVSIVPVRLILSPW